MLPMETINAVFPSSVPVGKTSIGPMTLLHVVAMEALGVECCDRNTNDLSKSVLAAWILSHPAKDVRSVVNGNANTDAMSSWMEDGDITPETAYKAVDRVFADAFSTYVQPKDEEEKIRFDDLPDGFGWPIELAETIAHEHGRSVSETLEIPLVSAFALQAVMRQRYGGKFSASDYYGRIREKRIVEKASAEALSLESR